MVAAFPGEGAELGADLLGEPLVAGREIAFQITADEHFVIRGGDVLEHRFCGLGQAVPAVFGHIEPDGPLCHQPEQDGRQQGARQTLWSPHPRAESSFRQRSSNSEQIRGASKAVIKA